MSVISEWISLRPFISTKCSWPFVSVDHWLQCQARRLTLGVALRTDNRATSKCCVRTRSMLCLLADHTATSSFFANNLTLLASSVVGLQAQLEIVDEYFDGSCAKFNLSKLVLLALNRNTVCPPLPVARCSSARTQSSTMASSSAILRSVTRLSVSWPRLLRRNHRVIQTRAHTSWPTLGFVDDGAFTSVALHAARLNSSDYRATLAVDVEPVRSEPQTWPRCQAYPVAFWWVLVRAA